MLIKKSVIILSCGLFLILDQIIKLASITAWTAPNTWKNFFGWQPFQNPGIAFGIYLPNQLTILFTLIILVLFLYLLYKNIILNEKVREFLFLSLIIFGAISNLVDRILFNVTIDYLRILTGIINLADVMIVVGFCGYLIMAKRYN